MMSSLMKKKKGYQNTFLFTSAETSRNSQKTVSLILKHLLWWKKKTNKIFIHLFHSEKFLLFSKALVRGLYITSSQPTDPHYTHPEHHHLKKLKTLDQACIWDRFAIILGKYRDPGD